MFWKRLLLLCSTVLLTIKFTLLLGCASTKEDPFEAYKPKEQKYVKDKTSDELYDEKVKNLKNSDIEGHFKLAQWCDSPGIRGTLSKAVQKFMYHLKVVLQNNEQHPGAEKLADSIYREYIKIMDPQTPSDHRKAYNFCMKMHYVKGAKNHEDKMK